MTFRMRLILKIFAHTPLQEFGELLIRIMQNRIQRYDNRRICECRWIALLCLCIRVRELLLAPCRSSVQCWRLSCVRAYCHFAPDLRLQLYSAQKFRIQASRCSNHVSVCRYCVLRCVCVFKPYISQNIHFWDVGCFNLPETYSNLLEVQVILLHSLWSHESHAVKSV